MSQADSRSQAGPRALISIGDAWRHFIGAKFSELLADDFCKPPAPGGHFKLERNPDTDALEPVRPQPEAFFDFSYKADKEKQLAWGEFIHFFQEGASGPQLLAFDKSGKSIRYRNWKPFCNPTDFWATRVVKRAERDDGGALSWLAVSIGVGTAVDVYFDRDAFLATIGELCITDDAGRVIAAAIPDRGELFVKWAGDRQNHRSRFGDFRSEPSLVRDDLLEAAALGLINGDEAERLAVQLQCAPIAEQPEANAFDAMRETFWTLPMVVQWIASRDAYAATSQIANYRESSWYWYCEENVGLPKDGVPNGYIIKQSWRTRTLAPPSVNDFILRENGDESPSGIMYPGAARNLLWDALKTGALEANGRKNGQRQVIEPMLWQDLLPMADHAVDAPEYLREDNHGARWDDVTVRRDDVLRIWPPSTSGVDSLSGEHHWKTSDPGVDFQAPRPDWIELALAPVHFRAMWDKGKYLPGTDLLEMASWFQYSNIGRVSISPDDGALFIEWDFAYPDGRPCKTTVRYSPPGLDSGFVKLIDDNPSVNFQDWPNVPPELWQEARNLTVGATSLQERLLQEFRYAIDAGICQIFARVGGSTASFKPIPADIFRKYEITSWGSGIVGGATASIAGAPPLFAIYAATNTGVTRIGDKAPAKHLSKRGRREEYDWKRIGQEAVRLMLHHGMWTGDDPEWHSQACLERAIARFCQQEFRREPATSGIRKRIAEWTEECERQKSARN